MDEGEKDAEPVKPYSVANGNVEMEEKTEPVMEKKEEQHDGVTEMEEENKVAEKVESNNVDMDKGKENDSIETEEEAKNEDVKEVEKDEGMEDTKEEEEKLQVAEEKVEMEIEEMNHDPGEKTEVEDKFEDKVDGGGEEEKPKESKEERGPKNRLRTKSGSGKKDKSKKQEAEVEESSTPTGKKTKDTKASTDKNEKDPKTPVAFTNDRPVRERKSVERLVAIIEQDAAKEFKVEKGRGTALKDIPNVAYKLSRKKTDDTFKLLHNILFGRRGKEAQVKNNISRFSGFVWHDDEEKQALKVKEKLDKVFKEKLVEFCDVLDIPIAATIRKEDIIAKLIEFLVAPSATTTELLAEKEQSSKGKKRKRVSKSTSGSITPSEGSAKSQKKTKGTSKMHSKSKPGDESEEEEETHDKDDIKSGPERSEDEISEPAEHEEKANKSEESDKDKRKKKQGSAKSSAKKGSTGKSITKNTKVTISKEASLPPEKEPVKSPSSRPKNKDKSAKRSSGKKKDESFEEKTSTQKKALSNASPGKKILKVKDNLKEEKLKPSDDELRNAICEILKEVDFNTATFTDILKLLAKRFGVDLMPRKPSIKLMIQDELTKIADSEEADDEKERPSSQRV